MSFYSGQKIVCVVHKHEWYEANELSMGELPQFQQTYTAGKTEMFPCDCGGHNWYGVYLYEINTGAVFDERAFKPLDTRKTDISIFTRMTKPAEISAPSRKFTKETI